MKAHLFLLVFITLFLTACSGGDEGVNYSEDDLIGKWYNTTGNNPNCNKDYIEFKADHNYKIIYYIMAPVGQTYEYYCLAL